MTLNLIQLIVVFGLGYFLIKESRLLTRQLKHKDPVIWLYRAMFVLGILAPVCASVIFIERYM